MAKTPKLPRPKAKKTLKQHLRASANKSISRSLQKNFGVLGVALSKHYFSPPKISKKKIVDPKKANVKDIKKKKIDKTKSVDDQITQSGIEVAGAIDTVAGNITKEFAVIENEMKMMGEEVSKSLFDLNTTLDRMMFKNTGGGSASGTGANAHGGATKAPGKGGGGGGGFGVFPIPFPSFKTTAILSIIPILKTLGLMSGQGGISSSREDMINTIKKNNERPEAVEATKRVEGVQKWLHSSSIWDYFTGQHHDTNVEPGKVNVGDDEHVIHKITYEADKINFKAKDAIEFKNKAGSASTSGTSTPGRTTPRPYAKPSDRYTQRMDALGLPNSPTVTDKDINALNDYFEGANNIGAPGSKRASGGGATPTSPPVSGGKSSTKDYTPSSDTGGAFGKGANISPEKMVASGVDPLLVESITEGGKSAFGDPNDPNTRFVVQMQGGIRNQSTGKHGQGKAVDLQIYDRQTKQFVGGSTDIMKNAFSNPDTYRIYEALHQARYAYTKNKYGEETAKRMSAGTKFGSSLEGGGADEMHASIDEGGSLGKMDKAGKGLIKDNKTGQMTPFEDWIAQGQGPFSGSKDLADPSGKSEFNPSMNPKMGLNPVQPLASSATPVPSAPVTGSNLAPPPPTPKPPDLSVDRTYVPVNRQQTKTYEDADTSDLDHRPKQEAVPGQSFSDYMSTSNGGEDDK